MANQQAYFDQPLDLSANPNLVTGASQSCDTSPLALQLLVLLEEFVGVPMGYIEDHSQPMMQRYQDTRRLCLQLVKSTIEVVHLLLSGLTLEDFKPMARPSLVLVNSPN